jgi:polyisoprenoid-binding protein YceI
MINHSAVSTVALLLCSILPKAWAQTISQRFDSGHSTASLTVNSASGGTPWNVGIAEVSGVVRWDESDITKSVFDFSIYPARQQTRLLDPDGSVRSYTSANLSRYTVMTFHSAHAEADKSGTLKVYGTLSITHVERETNITWSNAYTGPEYRRPVQHSTAHEVVFTIENYRSATQPRQSSTEISGFAIVDRKDFPGLRTALLDAVWPIVVEDEHCEMPAPKPSMKDYQGASCTGNAIEVTPIRQAPQRLGIDFPGPGEVTAPSADQATIVLRLTLLKGDSKTDDSPLPE